MSWFVSMTLGANRQGQTPQDKVILHPPPSEAHFFQLRTLSWESIICTNTDKSLKGLDLHQRDSESRRNKCDLFISLDKAGTNLWWKNLKTKDSKVNQISSTWPVSVSFWTAMSTFAFQWDLQNCKDNSNSWANHVSKILSKLLDYLTRFLEKHPSRRPS